jgi:outer membrane immunogenic protein
MYKWMVLPATLVSLAGSAFAADLPVKAPMVAPAPVFTWNGFYIGANVGGAWARNNMTIPGATGSEDINGVIGGGQIGYNWQFAPNWVFGIEGDIQGSSQKSTTTIPGATLTNKLPWFGTLRGRLGYAFADRWLVYATGGGAWVDMKSDFTITGLGTSSFDKTRGGWTAGAGIEVALDRNWSVKGEYLHIDAGSFSTNVFGVVPMTFKVKEDIGRVGFNYRF